MICLDVDMKLRSGLLDALVVPPSRAAFFDCYCCYYWRCENVSEGKMIDANIKARERDKQRVEMAGLGFGCVVVR